MTQRFGQEDSRKLTSAISSHYLSASKIYMNGQATFETARDTIRHELHSQTPAQFPYETRGTSVAVLTSAIIAPHDFVAISSPECTNCEYPEPSINNRLEFVLHEKKDMPKSICKWLESLEHETHEKCPHCFSATIQPISFKPIPRNSSSGHWRVNIPWRLPFSISYYWK
jgi:hypothetical protein